MFVCLFKLPNIRLFLLGIPVSRAQALVQAASPGGGGGRAELDPQAAPGVPPGEGGGGVQAVQQV